MPLVIDASVALSWCFRDEQNGDATKRKSPGGMPGLCWLWPLSRV
jgi:hypothetical protein